MMKFMSERFFIKHQLSSLTPYLKIGLDPMFPSPHLSSSLLLSSTFLLSACASKPPAPPLQEEKKTWSTELKTLSTAASRQPPKEVSVIHELWMTNSTPPPLSRVEVTLASTGVLAESNGSEGNYLISVGPGECQTEWLSVKESLRETKASRISQCRGQVTDQQRTQLQSSTALWRARCKGLSGGGVIDLHNIAVALSKAAQSPDALEGEEEGPTLPAPAWLNLPQERCGELKKLNQYLTQQHITYESAQLIQGDWAIWTRGMKAFGLSEIALVLVPRSRLKTAESTLLAAADFALRVEGLSEGQAYTSGVTQGLFANARKVAQYQPELGRLPEGLVNALVIVDPDASPEDQGALKKLALKLTIP